MMEGLDLTLRDVIRQLHISTLIVVLILCMFCIATFGKMALVSLGLMDQAYDSLPVEGTAQEMLETSFQNSVPGAGKLSTLDTLWTYVATGELNSAQVLQGSDGWLFYKSTTDGDSIADYTGANSYTEEEMESIRDALLRLKEQLRQKKQMLIVIMPPNKESVYAEYMPDQYVQAQQTRTDQLTAYLQESGIRVINPKETLLDQHDRYQLYYRYDTHWNLLGAYLGVREIMKSLEVEMPSLEESVIEERMLAEQDYSTASDDLANLVGLRDLFFDDDTDPRVKGTFVSFQNTVSNVNGLDYNVTTNENAEYQGRVLLIGDSFASYMLSPLLTEFTSVASASIETTQGKAILEDYAPDYVILEYVERYSENIKEVESIFADEQ